MLLSDTALNLHTSTIIDKSSEGFGWPNMSISIISSEPYNYELVQGGSDHLWLSMPLEPVRASFIVNRQELRLNCNPGEYIVHSPHAVFGIIRREPGSVLHVFLKRALLDEVVGELFDHDSHDIEVVSKFSVVDVSVTGMLHLLRRAVSEPVERTALSMDYISRALVAEVAARSLLVLPQRKATPLDRKLTPRQIHQVTDYIRQHLSSEIQLNELAGLVGLSRTTFAQSFKASLKETPHQYVIRTRIRQAKELLSKRDRSMTEVASICGFYDQAHFSRSFRKVTGVTPSTYRRQSR
jgi:AraC family transcriptional regulator